MSRISSPLSSSALPRSVLFCPALLCSALLCSTLFCSALLYPAGAAGAPRSAQGSSPRSESAPLSPGEALVLSDEEALLYAGPSHAYQTRARVYRGDQLRTLQVRGGWVEVELVGQRLSGWLQRAQVSASTTAGSQATRTLEARGEDERAARGRALRREGYRYDQRGRRVDRGGYVGSGEGTAEGARARQRRSDGARRRMPSLTLTAHVGAGRIERRFQSNIEGESSLASLAGGALMLRSGLAARWAPFSWLRVDGAFNDWRGGEVTFSAPPGLEGYPDFLIGLQGQRWRGSIEGGGALSERLWLGAGLGYDGLRSAAQQTSLYNLFLTHTHHSLSLNLSGELSLDILTLRASGGLLLPWETTQSPLQSGPSQSGAGGYALLAGAMPLNDRWALTLQLDWVQLKRSFSGPSTQLDQGQDPPIGYDEASASDTLWGLSFGLAWSQ